MHNLARVALAVAVASLGACASVDAGLPRGLDEVAAVAPVAAPVADRGDLAPSADPARADAATDAPPTPRPDPDCVRIGKKNHPVMATPEPGVVALTIDDGPMVDHTERVLDVLARHHVRATFFLVGRAITVKTFATVQRIVREGHALGNHTWRHDLTPGFGSRPKVAAAFYAAEIGLTAARIDLALLARDAADFEALDARVFAGYPRFMVPYTEIGALPVVRARLAEVLAERGRTGPLADLAFLRTPYGRPFMAGPKRDVALVLAAARAARLVPILWHHTSGDSDNRVSVGERLAPGRLAWWFAEAVRHGGILLAHDRIPPDSLDAALTAAEAEGVRWVDVAPLAQPPGALACGGARPAVGAARAP